MFTEQLAKTDDPRPHVIPGNTMSTIWTLYNRCDDLSKHGLQPADRALGEKKKKKSLNQSWKKESFSQRTPPVKNVHSYEVYFHTA